MIAIYLFNINEDHHSTVVWCSNNNNIMDKEITLKRKLVEVTNAVRKKFKQIKEAKKQYDTDLGEFYKPITKPITSIYNAISNQQQQAAQKPIKTVTTPKKKMRSTSASPTLGIKKSAQATYEPNVYESPRTPITHTYTPKTQIPPFDTSFDTPPQSVKSSSSITTPTSPPSNSRLVNNYLLGLEKKPSKHDTVYGVRYGTRGNKDKNYIGNLEVRFPEGKVSLYTKNSRNIGIFDGSPQLYELLFLKHPSCLDKGEEIDKNVLKIYKDILTLSDAAYDNYDSSKGLRYTKWLKYTQIINPLMTDTKLGAAIKKTTNKHTKLPNIKRLSTKSHEYVYWNKPKELVDRLRLLWSSKVAGHTGHDNEIMSIIEELREEGIIY